MYNDEAIEYVVTCTGNCMNVAASVTSNDGPMTMKVTSLDGSVEHCTVASVTNGCDGE